MLGEQGIVVNKNISWEDKYRLLKDNWKYSIKPMIMNYDIFDFNVVIEQKINQKLEKSTPFSRLKDLILGVYYIVKSTITYTRL
jgi:hypothetical protein